MPKWVPLWVIFPGMTPAKATAQTHRATGGAIASAVDKLT